MCVDVISAPTASPSILKAPGGSTAITLGLSSPTHTTVTIQCRAGGGLTGSGETTDSFSGATTVRIPLQLSGPPGAYVINIEITEPGCAPVFLAAGITITP